MKYLPYILIAVLFFALGWFGNDYFNPCSEYSKVPDKVDSIKAKIEVKEKEVDSLKEKKKDHGYTTKFKGLKQKSITGKIVLPESDSITPKSVLQENETGDKDSLLNEVYNNLLECDTTNKINESIIDGQDSIITGQKELIETYEGETKSLLKEIKKEKRKNLITKIGAGIAIVITILLVK